MAANDVPCCETMFWVYLITSVALVCFAGLMSGLTLGLMSLSLVDLEVLVKSGQPKDRRNAEKILPLVKNQHLLLCTLLIYNAMAMEALPIFLDSLLPAWVSILISVTLILAFGEIIPQAVCSQYGLSIGAKLAVLVRLLVIILLPISYPISKLLDKLLGKRHSALLSRSELKAFVDLHANEAGKGGELTHDETTIIGGALELSEKTAKDAMTPLSEVFSLDINAKLDKKTMELIMRKGHSRVPIYSDNPANIIGLILVKNLIACRPEDETPIRNLTIRKISRCVCDKPNYICSEEMTDGAWMSLGSCLEKLFSGNLPLYDILNEFQKGHFHMGVVVKNERDNKNMPEVIYNPVLTVVPANVPPKPEQTDTKGGNHWHRSTESSCQTLRMINAMELGKNIILQYGDIDILQASVLDSVSNSTEEVIGIITMEDVMEELLQEEIFDETDEYVDVHNEMKINMMSAIRSPPRSSGVTPTRVCYRSLRTPVVSPLSSYHNTPVLRSPIQPFIPAPPVKPTVLSTPTRTMLASPTKYQGTPTPGSPLKHISVNLCEKLQKLDN